MNPKLEGLFDEPENRYLKPEELSVLSQFISSLPERINFYRRLRNEELTLMQPVADALSRQLPQESEEKLKRGLQNAILMMRYAAMAMLADDPTLVTQRLESWLPYMAEAYDTTTIDQTLYQLIREQLASRFSGEQMMLITPGLDAAEALLSSQSVESNDTDITSETLVGLF